MSEELKGVKEFYNATVFEWADKWYADETMLPLLQKFISLFNDRPCILDAGCGAGYESMRLANLGADVVGVDISEESIKIARAKNPNCRFELMDCNHLDTLDMVFDGIVAIALLVHFEERELYLLFESFKKVVKSKGFLFVAFIEGNGFSEKRSLVEINGEKYNRAFYLHQISQLNEIAKNSGFEYRDEWFLIESFNQWKFLVYEST